MVRSQWCMAAVAALGAWLLLGAVANCEEVEPELANVRLAVGGKPALFYLPLTITERLGYFRDARLTVEIADFPGGARALQALIGGSADVVTGAYDHTIQMQAKGQPIIAVVLLGLLPGYVLGVLPGKGQGYHTPADLKGMKIGVTAPGSSTHFMVQHLMVKNGLARDDASFIGVGASASAVAAVKRGEIDAIVNVDPVISLLESEKAIKVVADTRAPEGTQAVYGGPYPAAVLYAQQTFVEKNPRTIQALVNALVRGLQWIAGHSPQEVAGVMPQDYALGNPAIYVQSIGKSLPMYSRDGRFAPEAAETAYAVTRTPDRRALRKTALLSRILRAPRSRIVAEGIGEYAALSHIAERGITGTLNLASAALSMVATAYTAGCGGCSGITASGRPAGHGIVAVDPRVIPLGTRMYIPGYGHAVAGDTGGAIRGNRIDLGFNSNAAANQFGRRSITVYLIK